jgi:hypothetical protein
MHCPGCRAAFIDWTGCCALTGANASCGAAFCGGWCLARDTGGDAHGHVLTCAANPNPGTYFGTPPQILAVQRARQRTLVTAFLRALDPDARGRALDAVARDLDDLGIRIEPF